MTIMSQARRNRSSSFIARKPPMLTSASFFALMVAPSVSEQISCTIDATEWSA